MTDRDRENGQKVEVWLVDLDALSVSDFDPHLLAEADRAQAERLRDHTAAKRLLSRRAATRSIVAETLAMNPSDVSIGRSCPACASDDHGRPYVKDSSLNFSVSSSGGLATVVTSESSVGVDIELDLSSNEPPTIGLTAGERRYLESVLPELRGQIFVRIWTVKEAVLKSRGLSLAHDPATVDAMAIFQTGPAIVVGHGDDRIVRQWACSHLAERQVILTVASSEDGPVEWHRYLDTSAPNAQPSIRRQPTA